MCITIPKLITKDIKKDWRWKDWRWFIKITFLHSIYTEHAKNTTLAIIASPSLNVLSVVNSLLKRTLCLNSKSLCSTISYFATQFRSPYHYCYHSTDRYSQLSGKRSTLKEKMRRSRKLSWRNWLRQKRISKNEEPSILEVRYLVKNFISGVSKKHKISKIHNTIHYCTFLKLPGPEWVTLLSSFCLIGPTKDFDQLSRSASQTSMSLQAFEYFGLTWSSHSLIMLHLSSILYFYLQEAYRVWWTIWYGLYLFVSGLIRSWRVNTYPRIYRYSKPGVHECYKIQQWGKP